MKFGNKTVFSAGFTLFELVVVLAILSAMVAVVLPLVRRSNDGLKIKQAGSSIAQTIRYAIDLAQKRNKAVKFIYNDKYRSYHLQIEDTENSFEPVEDFTGTERFINENIQLFDIEGFEQTGSESFLIFDPEMAWPNAWISFSTNDLTVTIRIKSKYVEIEEESI
ncbi:MAG: pilus assembly FimT family protein [Planctomycetota bacterium]|jgi:prepilin-type N-terminal cleavage/methylation domain-containing protein